MKTTPSPEFMFDLWAQVSGEYIVAQYRLQEFELADSLYKDHWSARVSKLVLRAEIFIYGLGVELLGLFWTWK